MVILHLQRCIVANLTVLVIRLYRIYMLRLILTFSALMMMLVVLIQGRVFIDGRLISMSCGIDVDNLGRKITEEPLVHLIVELRGLQLVLEGAWGEA